MSLVDVEIIGAMGWVGIGAVGATWTLLLLAAVRYACTLSKWSSTDATNTDFSKARRLILADEEASEERAKRSNQRDRIRHMVQTEMALVASLIEIRGLFAAAVVAVCAKTKSAQAGRENSKLNHPHDLLQRLSVLSCSATVALAVSLYWIRASGVAAEELGPGDLLKLTLFVIGVLSPPIWLLETAYLWLRRPVLDVIELGLIGAEERANWNRLRCMPKRVVPYRVAERYLAGKQIKVEDEIEALQRVEAPYFARVRDSGAIPRLLGAQASKMRRHEPWLWHMGAAWLCWSQLEDDERREAGHGAARWVMEHMARYGRLASPQSFGPDGLRTQGGAAADSLARLSGRSLDQEADYRLWHALSLVGEILAQLDGWAASNEQLRKVAKRARKEVHKQHPQESTELSADRGTDPQKVATSTSDRLIVLILGLESPTKALARGNSAADAARDFMEAAMNVCDECRQKCAAWEGPDDTRFVAALHCAARGMWVFVRDHLHQQLRREKVVLAPFPVAQMPQHVRKLEDESLVLYRSSAEPPLVSAEKPFAQRRLRPGEEKLVASSKTVFLPRREKEGFGFHIDGDGIVDGLAKTANGAQIAKGISIGMRLLAVDTVLVCSTTEVSQLLEKHKIGRAARFELRPSPPPPDQVLAEKREEKAAKTAAMTAAIAAASKPYGNRVRVTCPPDATAGTRIVINDSFTVVIPAGVKPGEQFDVRPARETVGGSVEKDSTELTEGGDNLLLASSLVSSLKISRFDDWQAEQAAVDHAEREKQRMLESVAGSVADVARQEVALMADRPDLQEAEEDLVDWLGQCNTTKQANAASERAVREQSADAERVVTAIEQAVWDKVCRQGVKNGRGSSNHPDRQSDNTQALVLHGIGSDDHGAVTGFDQWEHQGQQLQLQEEHQDNERLIARRPLAFFLPGAFGAIASGVSGAWVIWVDQELQLERLAIDPVGLPLVAFDADPGLLLRVWLWIASVALLTKFVLIDVTVVVGSIVCCKDYSISDLAIPMPAGVHRPSSALSRPSSAATAPGSSRSRPSSAVLGISNAADGATAAVQQLLGAHTTHHTASAMSIANGHFGGSDSDSDSDSDGSRLSQLPGSIGHSQVGTIHGKSQHRRPNSAGAVVGFAQSAGASEPLDPQIAPVGIPEHSATEPQPLHVSRRPNSAGAVVRFEEPERTVRYEL